MTVKSLVSPIAEYSHSKQSGECKHPKNMLLKSLLVLSALVGCTVRAESYMMDPMTSDISGRILNGRPATKGQFPYQALLIMTNAAGNQSFCGGSLVRTNYVLSAAHCCVNIVRMNVWLGMINVAEANQTDSGVVKVEVTSDNFIIHKDYNPKTFANDICLIKLPTPVQTNANINLINLPTTKDLSPYKYDFQEATISGFGQTNFREGLHPQLMYSTVRLQPHIVCALFYFLINEVSNYQLCSGKLLKYSGPCHGDSGGPLTMKDSSGKIVEIGLVSWTILTCGSPTPIVYTYLPAYVDWLEQNMK